MNIIELHLLSNDIHKTESYYTDILGFKIVEKREAFISFQAGASLLIFNSTDIPNPVYHFAFNIPKNKLEEALLWLNSRLQVIPVSENNPIADFADWNAKAIYFYDNNGNILEFIARFDLDNAIDIEFDSSCIQSISEIGIVCRDVIQQTYDLMKEYKLGLFSNPELKEQFAAIGDNEGLFIVVREGRDWYPTKIKSEAFWFSVSFMNNDGEVKIERI